jgi:hypothetical protein
LQLSTWVADDVDAHQCKADHDRHRHCPYRAAAGHHPLSLTGCSKQLFSLNGQLPPFAVVDVLRCSLGACEKRLDVNDKLEGSRLEAAVKLEFKYLQQKKKEY